MAILVDVIYKLLGIKIKHSAVSLEFIINSISPRYTHNSLLITHYYSNRPWLLCTN